MKYWLGYGLLGVAAYVLFLLLQFPAPLLVDLVSERLPGLTVASARGSAVQGSARDIQLRGTPLESMTWQLRPWALLTGKVEYRFILTEPDLHLRGVIGIGLDRRLYVTDLSGHLPLPKAIALAGRPPPPVNGEVTMNEMQLQLGDNGLPYAASGTIELLDTHTSFGRTFALGDFSAEFTTEDSNIQAAISDDGGGPLELDGILTLTPDGHYRFNGQVAVRDNNPALRQALKLLGQLGGDGKWQIDFSGVLQV